MDARRIFSRGGQIRGMGTKVAQWGPQMELQCAKPQMPTTDCENNA